MTPGPSDGRAARLLDALALGLFAAHAAFRLSLRGGDGSWGSNLYAHLLVPFAAVVWLTARALDRRLPWRLSGLEIPLAALAAIALISTFGASYRLAAMDGTAGWCAAILAVPLALHLFGPEGRASLVGLMTALTAVIALFGCIQYVDLGDLQNSPTLANALAAAEDAGELEGRVRAREPWSTFNGYPNTFAGFLVLALPLIIGAALDARSKATTVAAVVIAAAGGFGLSVSGATGAAVAAVAAAAAFALLAAARKWPAWRRRLLIGAGAAVGVAVLLVSAGPLSPNALAKRSEAIAIRDVYWDAALRVSKDHPFGVGLNNFQDYYYDHKDERQEEVRQVHNDYLQVLSELGIPGLLAFLALLSAAVFVALKPSAAEPVSFPPRWPLMIGLFIGWFAAFGLQGTFGSFEAVVALGAVGLGTYWIFSRAPAGGDFTRIGLAAGLAGAAVHFMVDFDLTDPAFRHFFFLTLAAAAVSARLELPSIAGKTAPAILAAVLFLLVIPLAAAVAPRFLQSEEHARDAAEAEAIRKQDEADASWEAAAAANVLDPDPSVHRGLREFQRWASDPDPRRGQLAITALEEGLRRRPRSAAIESRLAEVHEALARTMTSRGAGSLEAAEAAAHQADAERHARRAVELYPTRAYHRYLLGRILDEGDQDGAEEFREALRLSSLAVRVPRLRLDGLQAAVATMRTGGTREQAVALYVERPRKRIAAALLAPVEKSIVDAAADSK
jgi:hypothetical protein